MGLLTDRRGLTPHTASIWGQRDLLSLVSICLAAQRHERVAEKGRQQDRAGLNLASRGKYPISPRLAHATGGGFHSSAARASSRPRAENGLFLTLPLNQRLAGWRTQLSSAAQNPSPCATRTPLSCAARKTSTFFGAETLITICGANNPITVCGAKNPIAACGADKPITVFDEYPITFLVRKTPSPFMARANFRSEF